MAIQGREVSGAWCQECVTNEIIFITLSLSSLLLSFILNIPQRPQVFQNIGRRHDICLKIKIFAERYPFLVMTPATNVKIAFLADFKNDGWKETKCMDQKAGSIAIVRWMSIRLSLQEFSKFSFKCE